MFIEVLAEDGKSGLINENEVMAIQPNSFDDKARLVLVSINPKDGGKLSLYSALPYSQLVKRLTAHTVSVSMEDEQEQENGGVGYDEIAQATLCGRCSHPYKDHNFEDGCMAVTGVNHNKTLNTNTAKYCECREFVIPLAKENPAVAN